MSLSLVDSKFYKAVKLLQVEPFEDIRGDFLCTYSELDFWKFGIRDKFVRDYQSYSYVGVLRGLHYHVAPARAKLVRVVKGRIFDVIVDLRKDKRSFGKWTSFELCDASNQILYIPEGFAHGFYTLEPSIISYKMSNYYVDGHRKSILYNDPGLGIRWPFGDVVPIMSQSDMNGDLLVNAEVF